MEWVELLNWTEYSKLLIGLIVITDPVGSLPIVVSLTAGLSTAHKMRILGAAVITFSITLLIFTYLGTVVLDLFGITIGAFQVAGGILFLFYALEMMGLIRTPGAARETSYRGDASLGIVPLGIPMLAGPGTISKVVIVSGMQDSLDHKVLVSAVVLSVAVLIYGGFRLWLTFGPRLSPTTLQVIKSIMGLILAAIAVEYIFEGIVAHFPDLTAIF